MLHTHLRRIASPHTCPHHHTPTGPWHTHTCLPAVPRSLQVSPRLAATARLASPHTPLRFKFPGNYSLHNTTIRSPLVSSDLLHWSKVALIIAIHLKHTPGSPPQLPLIHTLTHLYATELLSHPPPHLTLTTGPLTRPFALPLPP